jgi:GH18 family chitinase
VVCYFTAWGQNYSGKGKFTPADLDPVLRTHINFAFAGLISDQVSGRATRSNKQMVWIDAAIDPKTVAGIRAAVAKSGTKKGAGYTLQMQLQPRAETGPLAALWTWCYTHSTSRHQYRSCSY